MNKFEHKYIDYENFWNFYFNSASDRGSDFIETVIDLGLKDFADAKKFPLYVQVKVGVSRFDEDGNRSADYHKSDAFASDLLANLMDKYLFIEVGTSSYVGYTLHHFYFPTQAPENDNLSNEELVKQLEQICAQLATKHQLSVQLEAKDDPQWREYTNLYPTIYEVSQIRNRGLLARLQMVLGFAPTDKFWVRYYAYFRNEQAAQKFYSLVATEHQAKQNSVNAQSANTPVAALPAELEFELYQELNANEFDAHYTNLMKLAQSCEGELVRWTVDFPG